jgi:putative transposase
MLKQNKYKTTHRPPHIYRDNTYYFITAGTFHKQHLFNTKEKMRIFTSKLSKTLNIYNYSLYAWVLLTNHYHLLIKISSGQDLANFIRKLHSDIAISLNRLDRISDRQVWYQYWDHCIRDEKDFYEHFNYIHHNTVKHGIYKEQKFVVKYSFCSYRSWLNKKGVEWLASCFEDYPILDFTMDSDSFDFNNYC